MQRDLTVTNSRTGASTYDVDENGLADVSESGKPLAMKNARGDVTRYAYDILGRLTETQLPNHTTQKPSITHTSYWPTGQVKAKWGSQTNPIFNIYDEQNRLTTLRTYQTLTTEPQSDTTGYATTTWNYSASTGLLLSKLDNDSRGATYTYTAAGRLETRAWARGVTTTYTYNQGLLTLTDYSDSTPDVTQTYDALGRQSTVTQTNQSQIEYTYAADLSIDTETISYDVNPDGTYDFTRALDRHDRLLGRDMGWALKAGNTTENQADYAYDATTGRLATVADASSSFSYGYVDNSQGLLHTVTGPVHTVTNTWEANRDVILTKGNSRNIDASDISSIGYTVNAIGQRTNATRSGAATNSTAWAYDNLGQLVQADDSAATSDRAYQYDSIGNREKTAIGSLELPGNPNYVANALNQYTTIPQATATPVYDLDGNMTTGPLPVSPTTNSTLVWDAENRLVEIKNGATTLAAYSYDALSRRISATVGEATTLYLYDGFNSIAEYSGTTLAKTYLWGMDLSGSMQGAGGVGGLLAENHHAGSTTTTFYPCFDGNGNITEYLNSDGISAAHFEYDPFGNTVVNTGSVELFNYRFSTKPLDFETGLYYYNYRYYDPLTGRWPSRDPIGEMGGMNLYGFVGNDGVGKSDRLGLQFGGEIAFVQSLQWPDAPQSAEYYTPPPANTASLPDLTLSFKKSFSIEGCTPTGIPGVVVCLKGEISIKVGKCCDGKKTGRMAEASGQITAGPGVGTGGWTVSDDIAGGEFDFGMPACPTETKPEVKGVINMSANAGPGSVECSYTFPGGSWTCRGSLAASASTGGANASIQGGINVSGKFKQ